MNKIKQFSNYLLKNHTLIWHSKIVLLLVSSLVLFIISMIVGYGYTNLAELSDSNLLFNAFESNYIGFHVIFCILTLTIWGFRFFKNNPFKNFYPIGKFYLHKLFLLILAGVTLLLFSYKGFNLAAVSKAKQIYATHSITSEILRMNECFPFLGLDKGYNEDNYRLSARVYPSPFPLNEHVFSKNDLYGPNDILYTGNYIEDKKVFVPKLNQIQLKKKFENDQDRSFFYSIKTIKYRKDDECKKRVTVVDSVFDLYNFELHENHLENFSSLYYEFKERGLTYKNTIAPRVHEIINLKKYSEIATRYKKLKKILDSYELKYVLDEALAIEYFDRKNFTNLKTFSHSYYDSYTIKRSQDRVKSLKSQKISDQDFFYLFETKTQSANNAYAFQFPDNSLETVFDNYYRCASYSFFGFDLEEDSLFLIFFSLSVSLLLFWISITPIIPLILALVCSGVIAIGTALFILFLSFQRFSGQNQSIGIVISVLLILSLLHFIFLRTKSIKRIVLDVSANIAFFISVIFTPIFFFFLENITRYEKYNPCTYRETVRPFSYLLSPYVFYFSILTLVCLFIFTLKSWKGKAE